MYALSINDLSTKSLVHVFEKHIDKKAKITTNLWKGYRPLSKKFNMEQIPSNKGLNFRDLHTMSLGSELPILG